MKKITNGFKVLIADERGRALLKLGIYIFFIIIIVLYARVVVRRSEQKKESVETAYDKFITQTDYVADIKFDDQEISLIGGEIISFNYAEEQYTVIDSKLMKNEEIADEFEIYFWKVTPKYIGELLKNKEPEYTSNYKDGLVKYGYKISLFEFIKGHNIASIDAENIEDIPKDYVEIILDDNFKKIELVTLNLDSYYKFITGEEKTFTIEIKY